MDRQAIAARLTDKSRAEQDLEWGIAQLRHLIATASINARLRDNSALERVIEKLEQGQAGLLAHIETLTQQVAQDAAIIKAQAAYIESYKAQGEAALIRAEKAEQQRDAAHAALREIFAAYASTEEPVSGAVADAIVAAEAAITASAPQTDKQPQCEVRWRPTTAADTVVRCSLRAVPVHETHRSADGYQVRFGDAALAASAPQKEK